MLVGLTLLGALARFATLDVQSFHHDEAVTAGQVLSPSLAATLEQVVDGERSPPLYYVLAWAWSTLFGTGEFGLRSLSALVGTLMVPVAFFAGRALASDRVGLTAALFFAVNPYLVWYSQEARSYILMALFATAALTALATWDRGRQDRSLWLWAAASALALLSHYFAVFLIAPQVAWILMRSSTWKRCMGPLAALTLVGLALLPLALAQQGSERREGFTDRPVAERVVEVGLNFVAGEDPDPLSGSAKVDALQITAGALAILLLGLAAWLIARLSPAERARALRLVALAVVAIGAPAILAFAGLDLLNPRNALGAIVPVLLAAALIFGGSAGILARLGVVITSLSFAVVVLVFNLSAEMQREDWRGAALAMGPPQGVRIVVAPKNGDDPLELYLDATKFEGKRFSSGVDVKKVQVLNLGTTLSPPNGFSLARTDRLPPLFHLETYESGRPLTVTPEDFDGVIGGRTVALIDR